MASRSSLEVRLIAITIPGWPSTRLTAVVSSKSSRTWPRSPTVRTTPVEVVTRGIRAMSSPTTRLFLPRNRTSWLSVFILPPGNSIFSRRSTCATCCSVRPCFRSVCSGISTSIWKFLTFTSSACETEGSSSSSLRIVSAICRNAICASGEVSSGPIKPTRMAGDRKVICWISGSSAKSGKLGMRSISARTSCRIFWTLTFDSRYKTRNPAFS